MLVGVDLSNGDPIWISIAQTGIVVKRSRMGLLGAKLYSETDVYKAARTAEALHGQVSQYATPAEMTNPVLRAFTQAALDSESATQLCVRFE